jgi:hypothetical protein
MGRALKAVPQGGIEASRCYYEELARRLRENPGLNETKVSVANKLSRGTFSASFFAAMKAIGRQTVNLEEM